MEVTLRYFAQLRRIVGRGEDTIGLPGGSTVADAVAAAAVLHPQIDLFSASLMLTLNEEWAGRGTTLQDGDVVGLMPPVSGG